MMDPSMKIAAGVVGVLAVLGLALLLVPAAQSQQTKPPATAGKGQSGPEFQDDIHVKPKGGGVDEGWEWYCKREKCKDGSELFLRDDLFFKINIFQADQPNDSKGDPSKSQEVVKDLQAVKFTIPVVIEVKRGGTGNAYFEWFVNGKPLLDSEFKKCTHGTDECKDKYGKKGSGIPVSWLNGIQSIKVMYKNSDVYVDLGKMGTLDMQGLPEDKPAN